MKRLTPYTDRLRQYMANVSMKLNLKLQHTNHGVNFPADVQDLLSIQDAAQQLDTIILGADVTHPTKSSPNPSIAAVVGSVDEHYANYPGSVRFQEGNTEVCGLTVAYEY